MKSYLELNVAINRFYRQLGKEVYQQSVSDALDQKKVDKIIKKIHQNIQTIEKLQNVYSSEKVILKPEINKGEIPFYVFCKSCRAGNHPDSTHCIRCEEALK